MCHFFRENSSSKTLMWIYENLHWLCWIRENVFLEASQSCHRCNLINSTRERRDNYQRVRSTLGIMSGRETWSFLRSHEFIWLISHKSRASNTWWVVKLSLLLNLFKRLAIENSLEAFNLPALLTHNINPNKKLLAAAAKRDLEQFGKQQAKFVWNWFSPVQRDYGFVFDNCGEARKP